MKCRVPMCPRHMGCNQPDRQRDGRRLGRLPECLPDAVSHRRAEKISCRQAGFPPLMRRTSVLRSKTLKWAEFISDHLSPMKGLPPGSRSRWDTDLCGEQTGPQIVYGKRQGDRAKPAAAVSRSVRRRKCGFWRGDSPRGNTPSAQTNQQILRIR